ERCAEKPVGRCPEVETGGDCDRRSGIIGEERIVLHLEPGYVARHPAVGAIWPTLGFRDRNLISDRRDDSGTHLQRHLGEEGYHARRDEKAVVVVGQHLLPGGGEVLVVGVEACLLRVGSAQVRVLVAWRRRVHAPLSKAVALEAAGRWAHAGRPRSVRDDRGRRETEPLRTEGGGANHCADIGRNEIDVGGGEVAPDLLDPERPKRAGTREADTLGTSVHDEVAGSGRL